MDVERQIGIESSVDLAMFMSDHRLFVCLMMFLLVVGFILVAEFVVRKRVRDAVAEAVEEALESEAQEWAEEYGTLLNKEKDLVKEEVTRETTEAVTQSVTASFEQEKLAILTQLRNQDSYLQTLLQNQQQMQEKFAQVESSYADCMKRLQEKDRILTNLYNQVRYFTNECEAYQQMVMTYDQALKDAERDKQFLLQKLEQFLSPEQLARLKQPQGKGNKKTPPLPTPDEDWVPYSEVSPGQKQ